jgi:hypothetical protein
MRIYFDLITNSGVLKRVGLPDMPFEASIPVVIPEGNCVYPVSDELGFSRSPTPVPHTMLIDIPTGVISMWKK